MLSEIKLVVFENNKIVETIIKETSTQSFNLVKSLEEFQRTANATLTKMIDSHGDSAGGDMDIEDDEESEGDEGDLPNSPKKRKNK